MKPKDIFGLAVRLLGLFFLCLGLRGITPLLDVGAIETADKSDLINAILPVAFNLAVAWWLLGGGWPMRRAYPERPGGPGASRPLSRRANSVPESAPSHETAGMDQTEQRLASLVERPKDGRAA